VHLAKGGNILEYRANAFALSKPNSSCPSITLALQAIQTFEHKRKKEKALPLEIRDEISKEFVVVYKKCFMKYGSQLVKQVFETRNFFQVPALSKPIIWEKSQHNGIGSHLIYLNLQHCNVSLNFDKIQLVIVKRSQSISLIFNVQLKSSSYQFT
jgi:hypothetical protein